jgi:mono/diheme cytochrome c family protein
MSGNSVYTVRVLLFVLLFGAATSAQAASDPQAASPQTFPDTVKVFLTDHCVACHDGADAEGGLDLNALKGTLDAPGEMARWIRIFDRVHAGEMPPKDADQPDRQQLGEFLGATRSWLSTHQKKQWEELGRVCGRRLTNLQLERTLHDLLGIDIPLASLMADEPRPNGFTTVADGQPMSHFQIQKHLEVVDTALDEAFRRVVLPNEEWKKSFSGKDLSRRRPSQRTREPELIDGQAVTWSGTLVFYGRLPATTAREDGWYRFKVNAAALKAPESGGVWCTVRTGPCVSSAPLMAWAGSFEATMEPQEWTFECWLPAGHMLEIRPGDRTLKQARFNGGQVGTGEGGPQNVPGVAIESIEMERVYHGGGNWLLRQSLFGELKVAPAKSNEPATLVSENPEADVPALMHAFAERAFRRPLARDEVTPYTGMVLADLENDVPLLDALRGGYRAILCSPRFLYFHETPGPLDDYAVAARLSYFLWNTMPDAQLVKQAEAGNLTKSWAVQKQVERMLADDRGKNFVRDFAAEWLDLSLIDFTEPDPRLYRDFDIIVQQSMLDETHAFLQTMVDEDLSVGNLVDSDFTFLNSRLSRFYQIDGVAGDELRRFALKPEYHRGGLLTHGAILKVTANGTTTSPVIRGLWISERLLGVHVPPPPENVPAIEPDIRGAKSIREMLAKHRADDSCASCHVKIDPPGFALENFNPAGQWRDAYYVEKRSRNSPPNQIDASYDMPDGRHFEDFRSFQKLVLTKPDVLASNLVEKLVTYGTGTPVTFADRKSVKDVVDKCEESGYGFRSLLTAVASHQVFMTK